MRREALQRKGEACVAPWSSGRSWRLRPLELRQVCRALDDKTAFAGNHDIVPRQFAPEVAAALREMTAVDPSPAEPLGPVRYQYPVSRAADGVFRQTCVRREHADNDVAIPPSPRGRDHRATTERGDLLEVGPDSRDTVCIIENRDMAERRDMRLDRP